MNSTPAVDLVWIGGHSDPPVWDLGQIRHVDALPGALEALIKRDLPPSDAIAWLFWSSHLTPPDPTLILRCLTTPAELWHAGLTLGMAGLPGLIDFVHPTWMLNHDPDPGTESSSWRVSLDACLIRMESLRQLGGLAAGFDTLSAAGLELGHRALTAGMIMRHTPDLLPTIPGRNPIRVTSLADEARFVRARFGTRWLMWALARAALSGYASPSEALHMQRAKISVPQAGSAAAPASPAAATGEVAVIIPTFGRYAYLRTVLDQLRMQTVAPAEVIVIDQNPPDQRDPALEQDFNDLPLTVLVQEMPGQCTARNTAIQRSRSEFLLFLDDDDEIPPDLIAAHLGVLHCVNADASCGRVNEIGAGPVPPEFAIRQISSVFPTNNAMIRRAALSRSGLFDTNYDRTFIDDADLGMRLYHSGALLIYEPSVVVLHHHAPVGGLRAHRQRVITYSSSRLRLTHRSLPSISELYYAMRYFTPRQRREMIWMRVFGTFAIRGSSFRKVAKLAMALVMLPDTLIRIMARQRAARKWLQRGSQIPMLTDEPGSLPH